MNQKANEFRVLVIDDNPDVIKRLDRLSPKHQVGGNLWDVNVVWAANTIETCKMIGLYHYSPN